MESVIETQSQRSEKWLLFAPIHRGRQPLFFKNAGGIVRRKAAWSEDFPGNAPPDQSGNEEAKKRRLPPDFLAAYMAESARLTRALASVAFSG
jgi:hypothetical protein